MSLFSCDSVKCVLPKVRPGKKREMALMLSLVSSLNEIESGSNYEVENTSSAKNTVTQKLLLDGCMTTNGEEVRSCSVQSCQASSQEKGIELQLYSIYF